MNRVLDLFCKAGGAAKGYHDAGFEVIGIDIEPQPHYPYEFHRMDWRDGMRQFASWATLIHASPPCQGYSIMNRVHRKEYPRLIGPVRTVLESWGHRWVIENVPGAATEMNDPITLCGVALGCRVIRHRLFESPLPIKAPDHQPHAGELYSPSGHGDPNWRHRQANPHLYGRGYTQRCRDAMGIQWMNREELREAIPPSYTEWIGRQVATP